MKKYLLILTTSLAINGCSSLTRVEIPPSPITLPAQYQQASQGMNSDNIARWWQTWEDAQLTQLIELGLRQNYDLNIAKSRLDEVQAILTAVKAERSPQVLADAIIGGSYTDLSNNNTGKLLTGGLNATWEPDIWGQKQSDIDAAIANALVVKMKTYGVQILLTAQIAENYLRCHDNLAQQKLLKQTLATLNELKTYVNGRFKAGQTGAYEQQAVETQIQAVKAQQTTLAAQFATYQRSLAVLTGQVPQTFHLDKDTMAQANLLTKLPQPPSGQQPQDLLNKRPDLMAAAANIQAKAAAVAAAKANFLPRFDLRFLWQSGRLELNSPTIPDFNGWGSLAGFGMQLPIFTAGKIQANVDAKNAELTTALLEYDQAILQALAEVDNRYQLQYALNRQNEALKQTVNNSQQQQISAQKLFKYGDKTLDSVLEVKLTTLQYQQQLRQSRLANGLNLIALYQAIGNGWEQ